MPLVTHKVAEVIACFPAFEEDVACKSPEEFLAEFYLHEHRLVAVEVVLFDATEPLEPVRPC